MKTLIETIDAPDTLDWRGDPTIEDHPGVGARFAGAAALAHHRS